MNKRLIFILLFFFALLIPTVYRTFAVNPTPFGAGPVVPPGGVGAGGGTGMSFSTVRATNTDPCTPGEYWVNSGTNIPWWCDSTGAPETFTISPLPVSLGTTGGTPGDVTNADGFVLNTTQFAITQESGDKAGIELGSSVLYSGVLNLYAGHLIIPYVASDEDCTSYTSPALPLWRNSDGLIGYCKDNTSSGKVIIDNDTQTRCSSFEKLAAADDHMMLMSWNVDVTVVSYYCHYNKAAQATPAQLQLTQYDQSTVLTQTGSPTCIADTAGAATAQAVTANNVIPARTPLEFDVTNTPSADGAATYEICVNFHY